GSSDSTALTVRPYAFTYTIGNDSQTYGTAANLAADLPGTILTGINAETLVISYSSAGDTPAAHARSYAITGTVADGTRLASDYAVTSNNAVLTVNPFTLTYIIGSDHHVHGTPADFAADLPGTMLTGLNNENLSITYSSPGNTPGAHVGSYAITGTT